MSLIKSFFDSYRSELSPAFSRAVSSSKGTEADALEMLGINERLRCELLQLQLNGKTGSDAFVKKAQQWSANDAYLHGAGTAGHSAFFQATVRSARMGALSLVPPETTLTDTQRGIFAEAYDIKEQLSPGSAYRPFTNAELLSALQMEDPDATLPHADDISTERVRMLRWLSSDKERLGEFLVDVRGHQGTDVEMALDAIPLERSQAPHVAGRFENPSCLCYMIARLQLERTIPGIEEELERVALRPDNELALAMRELIKKANDGQKISREEMTEFFTLTQYAGWIGRNTGDQQDSNEFARVLRDKVGMAAPLHTMRLANNGETQIWDRRMEIASDVGNGGDAANLFHGSEGAEDINGKPPYIIQSLKRFNNDNTKNRSVVRMGGELEVNGQSFEPSSIVVHRGSTGGGHYVTYSKVDGSWYLYSDASTPELITSISAVDEVKRGAVTILWTPKESLNDLD